MTLSELYDEIAKHRIEEISKQTELKSVERLSQKDEYLVTLTADLMKSLQQDINHGAFLLPMSSLDIDSGFQFQSIRGQVGLINLRLGKEFNIKTIHNGKVINPGSDEVAELMYYYTPSIDDLGVGYECEWLEDPAHDQWLKLKLENFNTVLLQNSMNTNFLRTAWLSKEQLIKSEGFKKVILPQTQSQVLSKQTRSGMTVYVYLGRVWSNNKIKDVSIQVFHQQLTPDSGRRISNHFVGYAPSINEFRRIWKYLRF